MTTTTTVEVGKRAWAMTIVDAKAMTLKSSTGRQYVVFGERLVALSSRWSRRIENLSQVQAALAGGMSPEKFDALSGIESFRWARAQMPQILVDAAPIEFYRFDETMPERRHDLFFGVDAATIAAMYPEYDPQMARAVLTRAYYDAWLT